MAPRETIYAAFYALLAAITAEDGSKTFKSGGRVLKAQEEVALEEAPALYVLQKTETAEVIRDIPTRWSLEAEVYIYVKTETQPGVAPSTQLNPLVDAVIAALGGPNQPNTPIEQTLGGLVSKCRVAGAVVYGEGVLGDYGVAIVPVRITVPQ